MSARIKQQLTLKAQLRILIGWKAETNVESGGSHNIGLFSLFFLVHCWSQRDLLRPADSRLLG